jgi:hypothetical protein
MDANVLVALPPEELAERVFQRDQIVTVTTDTGIASRLTHRQGGASQKRGVTAE